MRTGRVTTAVVLAALTALTAGCSASVSTVDRTAYAALVPTAGQLRSDAGGDVPGGFAALRDGDADRVDLRLDGDTVTFALDGVEAASRQVKERREVSDLEGSGPFRAKQEVLVLGEEPLVLGGLTIDAPVIWPGGFAGSPVTLKPDDPDERGPVAQCRSDEVCLVLPVAAALDPDPSGSYVDSNPPDLTTNPISSIRVDDEVVDYVLSSGETVTADRTGETRIRACGVSESFLWTVPDELGLDLDDPVLAQTGCPLPAGEPPSVTVLERADLPVLARLAQDRGGWWCEPGPGCLWFIDEEGGEAE